MALQVGGLSAWSKTAATQFPLDQRERSKNDDHESLLYSNQHPDLERLVLCNPGSFIGAERMRWSEDAEPGKPKRAKPAGRVKGDREGFR